MLKKNEIISKYQDIIIEKMVMMTNIHILVAISRIIMMPSSEGMNCSERKFLTRYLGILQRK